MHRLSDSKRSVGECCSVPFRLVGLHYPPLFFCGILYCWGAAQQYPTQHAYSKLDANCSAASEQLALELPSLSGKVYSVEGELRSHTNEKLYESIGSPLFNTFFRSDTCEILIYMLTDVQKGLEEGMVTTWHRPMGKLPSSTP